MRGIERGRGMEIRTRNGRQIKEMGKINHEMTKGVWLYQLSIYIIPCFFHKDKILKYKLLYQH